MRKRGYTLIEALVSAVLLAVGIVSGLSAMSNMTRTEGKARETQLFWKIAQEKFDEVRATGDIDFAPVDGTFEEPDRAGISWSVSTEPSDVENLTTVRVQVYRTSEGEDSGITLSTLIFVQPEVTEPAAGGAN